MVALSVNSIRTAVYKNLLLESEKFNSSVLYRNAKHTPTLVPSVSFRSLYCTFSYILFVMNAVCKNMELIWYVCIYVILSDFILSD